MNKLERKSNEVTMVMLLWALIMSLAIEELYRKYGIKQILSYHGFGPIPVNQVTALIIMTVILLIGVGYVAYADHKLNKKK